MKYTLAQTVSDARPADMAGHTLLVWTREYIAQYDTAYGAKPAVRVDVVDLTDDGTEYIGLLWFGHRLTQQLRKVQADPQLGRMVKAGDDDAAPWELKPPNQRDIDLADSWDGAAEEEIEEL